MNKSRSLKHQLANGLAFNNLIHFCFINYYAWCRYSWADDEQERVLLFTATYFRLVDRLLREGNGFWIKPHCLSGAVEIEN